MENVGILRRPVGGSLVVTPEWARPERTSRIRVSKSQRVGRKEEGGVHSGGSRMDIKHLVSTNFTTERCSRAEEDASNKIKKKLNFERSSLLQRT